MSQNLLEPEPTYLPEDHPDMADMPFDGARMFWGGFAPIVDLR